MTTYPTLSNSNSLDPVLDHLIPKIPKLSQVQYDLMTQLEYLERIAVKYGLYDASHYLKKLLNAR
jgi:hypothetical protein